MLSKKYQAYYQNAKPKPKKPALSQKCQLLAKNADLKPKMQSFAKKPHFQKSSYSSISCLLFTFTKIQYQLELGIFGVSLAFLV